MKIDHKDMETIESFKSIYQAYIESNLTVRDFCKKIEIPEGRFYYWQKRIRNEAARSNGEFMPVSINNHAGKVVLVGNGRQQLAAKDKIIEKQKKTIDSLNAKLAWLQRKVWGQSSEKHITYSDLFFSNPCQTFCINSLCILVKFPYFCGIKVNKHR